MPEVNASGVSLVIPVHDEAQSLDELVRRCRDALGRTGRTREIVIVDDASRDETPRILARLAESGDLVVHRLSSNRGQIAATVEGLRIATGDVVVVLDGDLQDPPEVIPELLQALEQAPPEVGVAFAVKTQLAGPAWFRLGRAVHSRLLSALSGWRLPAGAGSYCAMRRATVQEVLRQDPRLGNLSAVLATREVAWRAVPYRKEERRHGRSRVGPAGLALESIASLATVLANRIRHRRRGASR